MDFFDVFLTLNILLLIYIFTPKRARSLHHKPAGNGLIKNKKISSKHSSSYSLKLCIDDMQLNIGPHVCNPMSRDNCLTQSIKGSDPLRLPVAVFPAMEESSFAARQMHAQSFSIQSYRYSHSLRNCPIVIFSGISLLHDSASPNLH